MEGEHRDILILQERCRKDPVSYKDDFISQKRHFEALLASAALRPSDPSSRLAEVASFMGAVAPCYKDEGASFVPTITKFLTQNGVAMDPDLRRALVRLLGLLRARNSADAAVVIPLFFRLLECNDKQLRKMLHGHIVADIKKMNASGHSGRWSLQSFLFTMLKDPSDLLVKRSLHVLLDLFRKKIWNDSKCANMIGHACFHEATPVALIACKFMLDSESKSEDVNSDDEDDGDAPNKSRKSFDGHKAAELWKSYNQTGKKTSKKRKRMEKVINRLSKRKSPAVLSSVTESDPGHPSLEAMMLLNDPQEFTERLFSDVQSRRRKESFENRLTFINLISRLIGTHQLILFNFYPFLQRYMQPSQPEVTRILAYITQACHDLVPPDVLHPILRGLADTFVSERSSPPAMAAGINTVRAICSRVPLAILDETNENLPEKEREAPLLEDLVQYRTSKDKGVVMAARSLISLYREAHPSLLQKKDRGKEGSQMVQRGVAALAKSYGAVKFVTDVDGIELLEKKSDDEESDEGGSEVAADTEEGGDGDSNEHEVLHAGGRGSTDSAQPNEGGKEGPKITDEVKTASVIDANGGDSVAVAEKTAADENEISSDDESLLSGSKVDSDSESDDNDETADVVEAVGDEGLNERNTELGSQPTAKRPRADDLKVLTDEDYAKIRARKAALEVEGSFLARNTGDVVDPDDLQGPVKRERKTLTERMESVLAGREGREKYGSRKGKDKGGGSTNKKKLKTKTNSMVIHKRRKRANMSRHDKQKSKRKKKDYK